MTAAEQTERADGGGEGRDDDGDESVVDADFSQTMNGVTCCDDRRVPLITALSARSAGLTGNTRQN